MASEFARSSGNRQWIREARKGMHLVLESGKDSKSHLNRLGSGNWKGHRLDGLFCFHHAGTLTRFNS